MQPDSEDQERVAHSVYGLAFADRTIAALCDKLQSDLPGGREVFAGKPRGVFINAVVLTVKRLTYRSEWVAKEQRVMQSWP